MSESKMNYLSIMVAIVSLAYVLTQFTGCIKAAEVARHESNAAVKIEAIKAGLVQGEYDRWVKPGAPQ